MGKKILLLHIGVALVLTLAGLFFMDRPVAGYMHSGGFEYAWPLDRGTSLLDVVTGKEISKFLLGGAALGVGLALLCISRARYFGWAALYVACVQLLSTLLSGISKGLFGRLRPYQVIESGDWGRSWFADGSSFPSGHAGFYFGLFLPLAFLFPRWRWPLLFVPWFIAVARVNANDHFISDVGASIALAAAIALTAAWLMKQRLTAFVPAKAAGDAKPFSR